MNQIQESNIYIGDQWSAIGKQLIENNIKYILNVTPVIIPKQKGSVSVNMSWGLLKCKTCDGVWNRDCNGATNIYKIAFNSINGLDRPNYLSRKRNLSGVLDDTSKPKFTRLETVKPFGIKIPLIPAF